MTKFMFDTNAINEIVKENVDTTLFDSSCEYFITPIQSSELSRTKDPQTKDKLLRGLKVLEVSLSLKTTDIESAPWGAFPWGAAKWGADGGHYKNINKELSSFKNKRKSRGNSSDGLIVETCLIQGHVLVSNDPEVQTVCGQVGVKCLKFSDFMEKYGV